MDRPVVGICNAMEIAQFGPWNQSAAITPFGYVLAVQRAGGIAMLLPPDPAAEEDPDAWLDRIDGLVLAGGVDMDPDTYGAAADPATAGVVRARDDFELALAGRAMARDMPF